MVEAVIACDRGCSRVQYEPMPVCGGLVMREQRQRRCRRLGSRAAVDGGAAAAKARAGVLVLEDKGVVVHIEDQVDIGHRVRVGQLLQP